MGYRRALLFLYPTFLDIKFLYPTQSKQSFFPTTPPKQLSTNDLYIAIFSISSSSAPSQTIFPSSIKTLNIWFYSRFWLQGTFSSLFVSLTLLILASSLVMNAFIN